MKEQHSTSDDETPVTLGPEYWAHFLDDLRDEDWGDGPHLITVDVLRAAGALDVPASWRKSLSAGTKAQRDLFSDLLDDDELDHGSHPATSRDPEGDEDDSSPIE